MENIKRTIVRLLAVIAAGMAMLLCGLLLGCYGIMGGGEFVPPNPVYYIKCIVEEGKDEYDIDDVSLDILYGFDIACFNNWASGVLPNNSLTSIDYGIFVTAYNCDNYTIEEYNEDYRVIDDKKLFVNLNAIEEGEVNDGALLIEKVPYGFSYGFEMGGQMYHEDKKILNINNLANTDYAVKKNKSTGEAACYMKKNVTLPRGLFLDAEGVIQIDILACIIENNDMESEPYRQIQVYMPDSNRNFNGFTISIKYEVEEDKVYFTDVRPGSDKIIDGTAFNLR